MNILNKLQKFLRMIISYQIIISIRKRNDGLDLKELERMLNESLVQETPESLSRWLASIRKQDEGRKK